jgi:hypothetical protein
MLMGKPTMANEASAKDKAPRWLKDIANVTTRRFGLSTVADRPGPDFLVVGTKRGGSTSIYNYLLMHPGILGLFPQNRGRKSTDYYFSDHYHRGEEWYRSHFHTERHRSRLRQRLGYRPLGGEASPYYIWDPRIAERVRRTNPDLRAVLLLRDPVKRAWSHYVERTQNGVEPLDFEDALAAEEARLDGELDRMLEDPGYHSDPYDWYSYRSRGDYLPQIENWRSVFAEEQLLVVRSEDMYADVQATVDTITDFLGLPGHRLPSDRTFNASRPGAGMPEGAAADLRAHFSPKVRALEDYLGHSLDWSV